MPWCKVSHNLAEVEISCLPKDLTEFLEVDVIDLKLNEALHLSDIKLPEGVTIIELTYGEGHDHPIVSVHVKRAVEEPVVTEEEAAGEEVAEEAEAKEETEDKDKSSEDESS